jgi:hypothetical protein
MPLSATSLDFGLGGGLRSICGLTDHGRHEQRPADRGRPSDADYCLERRSAAGGLQESNLGGSELQLGANDPDPAVLRRVPGHSLGPRARPPFSKYAAEPRDLAKRPGDSPAPRALIVTSNFSQSGLSVALNLSEIVSKR